MGVLGLTPFLQRHCPEVIKILPDRLRSLQGKTVVLDGTLITQRLHFSNAPHTYKHVLGWYRIMKEFKDTGVSAICVFDGKQRNLAKVFEVERRKEIRRIGAVRGTMELERFQRLHRLSRLLKTVGAFPEAYQRQLGIAMKSLTKNVAGQSVTPPAAIHSVNYKREESYYDFASEGLSFGTYVDPEDIASIAQQQEKWQISGTERLPEEGLSNPCFVARLLPGRRDFEAETSYLGVPVYSAGECIHELDIKVPKFDYLTSRMDKVNYTERIPDQSVATLAGLYTEYCNSAAFLSTPALDTGPVFQPDGLPVDTIVPVTADEDGHIANILSKKQQEMTTQEGFIWDQIINGTTPDINGYDSHAMHVALDALASQSQYIAKSYERYTQPPTKETYEQSQQLLKAMGVPILVTQGPYEAEALASSLVRHGHADYVASEDTDVLLYEVPLIRSITNKGSSLMIISGSEVRSKLELGRRSFIDFALLLGTDFSRRIKNVGPARALKFIRTYGSIERIVEHESKYPPRQPTAVYLHQVELARMVFDTLPPVPDEELLIPGEYDVAAVTRVLQQFHLSRVLDDSVYENALAGNYFDDDPTYGA